MKALLIACVALATLVAASGTSFAAKRMKVIAGGKCETGQSCTANCENGWCSRYVCVGNKWEKRLPACSQPFCRPAC